MTFPALPTLHEIEQRLDLIFPGGTPNRPWLVRSMCAKVVFVMLYGAMTEGSGRRLRPAHVYFFTDEQATLTSDQQRRAWVDAAAEPGFRPSGRQWYADTTREPIRDETLRLGLVSIGAVGKESGVATTSSRGVYFLRQDFAALFDPALTGSELTTAAHRWQYRHLTAAARARVKLLAAKRVRDQDEVLVRCPDGSVVKLAPGPSSVIAKAVVETFATAFLPNAALIWLSESANKVRYQDAQAAHAVGLRFDQAKVLPDIILANVGKTGEDTSLVFVEVVASDGTMDEDRKQQLTAYVRASGFPAQQVHFGTAFDDRSDPAFRRCAARLAWGTFAWFRAEPERLVWFYGEPIDITA